MGQQRLWWLVFQGNSEIAKLLIEKGADLNKQDKNGVTALITAVFLKNSALVQQLLAKGADLNARSRNGKTAFDYAADKPAILKMLQDEQQRRQEKEVKEPASKKQRIE